MLSAKHGFFLREFYNILGKKAKTGKKSQKYTIKTYMGCAEKGWFAGIFEKMSNSVIDNRHSHVNVVFCHHPLLCFVLVDLNGLLKVSGSGTDANIRQLLCPL